MNKAPTEHNGTIQPAVPSDCAVFISDAHLGSNLPYPPERSDYLHDLLQHLPEGTDHLVILGDLFDFWIEYRHTIRSDYFDVLHQLRRLVEAGVQVHYLAGNHDFALGSFLSDTIGVHVHMADAVLSLQNRRIFMVHGDGVVAADLSYRVLKKILRSPRNQRIFRLLHPEIGIGLATFFSRLSRRAGNARKPKIGFKAYRQKARDYLAQGNDIVVMGHTHHPEIVTFPEGKTYCNTGDWIRRFTYATMIAGQIRLWRYRSGAKDIEIQPIDFSAPDVTR